MEHCFDVTGFESIYVKACPNYLQYKKCKMNHADFTNTEG